ncbi:MAG: major facilitator superfamily 1 [Patescibacteria group bacterium]|nr:major facilitator superfamily 1 [Patescibacteria group bacterium]
MPRLPHSHNALIRRLLPLYISAFLQGFVLWYAIEKLFMVHIGFTASGIGLMAAAFSLATLLLETPSGILADRWSRRGVLMLASLALAVSSLICGLTSSIPVYIIGTAFWGMFFAFYSGTYDAIIYDALLEDTGGSHGYKRYYGYVRMLDGTALVSGALIGAFIGSVFSLRAPFLITVPIAILSIATLAFFHEPKLHRAKEADPILQHVRATFSTVIRHKSSAMGTLVVLVLGATLVDTVMEFNQLWLIAIATPVGLFGIATGIVLAAYGLSGLLANRLQLKKPLYVVMLSTLMTISSLVLILAHIVWLIVPAQAVVVVSLLSLGIEYTHRLHDRLPSHLRAGASSAVSSAGRALFILVSLVFGWITQHYSVFVAGWLIFIPLIVICLFLYRTARRPA